jgi:hypothetical protein
MADQTPEEKLAAAASEAAASEAAAAEAAAKAPNPLPVDQYLATRDRYIDGLEKSFQRIDEIVVAGAAGTLALSITFVHDIAPHPLLSTAWLLDAGWALLLLALSAALLSHMIGMSALRVAISHLDNDYRNKTYSPLPESARQKVSIGLDWISAIALGLGILALVSFARLNINFTESPFYDQSQPAHHWHRGFHDE